MSRPDARPRAVIFGCAGPELSGDEARFFAETDPLGFILFRRNCQEPEQIRRLVRALQASVGRDDAPVLIDQEGGRVARLGPPNWPRFPSGAEIARRWRQVPEMAMETAWRAGRMIAAELAPLGIDVDCAPVLDVPAPDGHDIIGDRAYGAEPAPVIALGLAFARGLLDGGVLPVIKHIPGHGRATADSHLDLPVVAADRKALAATDFAPFRALAHLPIAMTAHVVYSALDAAAPATCSARVIAEIVRGEIGFGGLLLSDDLSMKALTGSFAARTEQALAAGCDVALHCNGDPAEMQAIAGAAPAMSPAAWARWQAAAALRRPALAIDRSAWRERLDRLLAA
ncbi:beta-N-acetylhexosaminidase [Desertibaculum subflavum]|uniref:beta-N-acetylhexosaminidase n=1 Tax=Desertibaculum subflavum TaxID=2268458 RepID=UPI000E6682D0